MPKASLFLLPLLMLLPLVLTAQTPTPQSLQNDLQDLEVGDHWIYNDFQAAVAKAKSEGKPLFVLFR